MVAAPVFVCLSASGLAMARRLSGEFGNAEIHGLAGRAPGADAAFADTMGHLRELFAGGRPVIGICAAGILMRAIAPLLSDKAADYVWEVLDALVAAGCLQVVGDPYPILSLTPLGRKVMMRQQTVPLLLPQPGGRGAPAKRKTEMLIEAPDADPDLVALLKEWRRNKAAELGNKPAYTVYTDKTLHHLAAAKPATFDQLEHIHGVGPSKLQKYGEETLELIAAYQSRRS